MSAANRENVLKFPQKPEKYGKISKFFQYFLTPSGRRFSQYTIVAAASGAACIFAFPHTIFQEEYRRFLQAYEHGLPIKVPEKIELKIDEAVEKLELKVKESVYLKSFMISGFDIKPIGSVNSSYNGWIGIPTNFLYENTNDIDRYNLKIRNESIQWNTKYGELLEKSLVMSDDEKLFGIVRAILQLRNYNFVIDSLIPAACIFGFHTFAQYINRRFSLYAIATGGRVIVYGLLTIFGYGVYSMITDTVHMQQEVAVDKALVNLGADMCEAGIRYYEKVLNRNIAIRELSGLDLYTGKGNEYPGILRQSSLPLTTRKMFLEQSLEEIRKNEEKTANTNTESK